MASDYVREALVHLGVVDDTTKVVENLVNKMNKLEGSKHKVSIGADDKVSSTVNSITGALKGVNQLVGKNLFDIGALNQASSIIEKINKSFNLLGSAQKVSSGGSGFSGWATSMSSAAGSAEDLAAGEGAAAEGAAGLGAALAAGPVAIVIGFGLALAACVPAAANFQDSMTNLQIATGRTDEEMAQLSTDIQNMSSATGVGTDKIAGIMTMANKAGIAKDQQEAWTESVARFAVVTGMSTDQAAADISQLGTLYGLAPSQVDNIGSAMIALSNTSRLSIGDIDSALSNWRFNIQAVGLQMNETMAIMAGASQAGIQPRQAGNLLDAMQKVAPMQDSEKTMERYVSIIGSIKDPYAQAAFATQMFGDANGKMLVTMVKAGVTAKSLADDAAKYKKLLESTDTAQNKLVNSNFNEKMSDFNMQWSMLTNKIVIGMERAGIVVIPVLTDILSGLNDLAGGAMVVNEALSPLLGGLSKLSSIGGMTLGGPIGMIFGSILSGISGSAGKGPGDTSDKTVVGKSQVEMGRIIQTWYRGAIPTIQGAITGAEDILSNIYKALVGIATDTGNFVTNIEKLIGYFTGGMSSTASGGNPNKSLMSDVAYAMGLGGGNMAKDYGTPEYNADLEKLNNHLMTLAEFDKLHPPYDQTGAKNVANTIQNPLQSFITPTPGKAGSSFNNPIIMGENYDATAMGVKPGDYLKSKTGDIYQADAYLNLNPVSGPNISNSGTPGAGMSLPTQGAGSGSPQGNAIQNAQAEQAIKSNIPQVNTRQMVNAGQNPSLESLGPQFGNGKSIPVSELTGHAKGATFDTTGLFKGLVHGPEELLPQATTRTGPGKIAGLIEQIHSGDNNNGGNHTINEGDINISITTTNPNLSARDVVSLIADYLKTNSRHRMGT